MECANASRYTRTWEAAAHLAAFVPLPFGAFIGPIVVWTLKRHCPQIVDQAKRALNFQISWLIFFLCALAAPWVFLGAVTLLTRSDATISWFSAHDRWAYGYIAFLIACQIAWAIAVVVAAVSANVGQTVKYPFSIRFFR